MVYQRGLFTDLKISLILRSVVIMSVSVRFAPFRGSLRFVSLHIGN